jgi:hypothetical protein
VIVFRIYHGRRVHPVGEALDTGGRAFYRPHGMKETNMDTTRTREDSKPKAEKKAPGGLQRLDDRQLQELISRRAYELYLQRGREDGHDLQDWFNAEREIQLETERLVTVPRRKSRPASARSMQLKSH